MKRSPLRAKRATPRRNEGRIAHERMRPKASADPGREHKRYWNWLRDRHGRCEACGWTQELVIHHLLAPAPGKVGRRDHWFVVLICPQCHNMASASVHGLGSEAKFRAVHGVDLVRICVDRLGEYRNGQS